MNCFRCQKEINKLEHHYEIKENFEGNNIANLYVHKLCWDKFLSQLDGASSSLKKSNYLLNALGKKMKSMGMIDDVEEEVVLC